MKKILLLLFLSSLAHAETDLGPLGNKYIYDQFEKYKTKTPICLKKSTNARVIMTSFGPFEGKKFNISSLVTGALVNPKLPAVINTSHAPAKLLSEKDAKGHSDLDEKDYGGRVHLRTLAIDGKAYDICFINLEVAWDLAAAIIVTEMQSFQPHLVLMTGEGFTSRFETKAFNVTNLMPSHNHDGELILSNVPISSTVLEGGPYDLTMNWSANKLQKGTEALLAQINIKLAVANGLFNKDYSSYVCNNVSYAVIAATQNKQLSLAGNLIQINPNIKTKPIVGFLHIPQGPEVSSKQIDVWSRALAKMIRLSLP